jgi:hypothetical protein
MIKKTNNPGKNLSILIYGEPGSGKTPLIGTLPGSVCILDTDHGLLSLQDLEVDFIECNTLDEVRAGFLEVKQSGYDWIVLDSATALGNMILHEEEQIIIDAACSKRKGPVGNPMEGVDLRQAYQATSKKMDGVIRALKSSGMNVLVLAGMEKNTDQVTGVKELGPMVPGRAYASQFPGCFNVIMRAIRDRYEDGTEYTYLQCRHGNKAIARDRSDKLDQYEVPEAGESFPSLAALVAKMRGKHDFTRRV